jgi:hypothetical protein
MKDSEKLDDILTCLEYRKIYSTVSSGSQLGYTMEEVCRLINMPLTLQEQKLFEKKLLSHGHIEYINLHTSSFRITRNGSYFNSIGGYMKQQGLRFYLSKIYNPNRIFESFVMFLMMMAVLAVTYLIVVT